MEKIIISKFMPTSYFVNIESKIYGVIINIKDAHRASEIIQHVKETRKEEIEAWKQEWKEGVV